MYSPEIKPEKVKALYELKLKTGKSMTSLVDEAIGEYLVRIQRKSPTTNSQAASDILSVAEKSQGSQQD